MIAEIYFTVLQRNGSTFIGTSIYQQFKATCQQRGIKFTCRCIGKHYRLVNLYIDQERTSIDWQGLIDDPAIEKNAAAIHEWEAAWNTYIQKLNRLQELKDAGRYGYQLNQPYKAIRLAKEKLQQLDPEFCVRQGIY